MSCLFVNKRWKNTDLFYALSSIKGSCEIDESLDLIDFKTTTTGFIYISSSKSIQNQAEFRKQLAKIYNNYTNLSIQVLIDYSISQQEFSFIQELCVIELKIRLIPVDTAKEIAPYLECFIANETNIDSNPFVSLSHSSSSRKPNELFHDTLKNFIRVSEDSISHLEDFYKSLRQLSNASFEELSSEIGAIDADKILKFFNS